MKKFIILYIPFMFSPVNVFGQDDTTVTKADTIRTPVDTIYFSGYMAINFSVRASNEENWFENEWEVYLCDKKLLTSFRYYPGPDLYNFNYDPNGVKKPRYLEDINGDKKGEMIFVVESGGSGGDMSAFIYVLDTIAVKIADFGALDGELRAFRLEDIDGDGISEVVFGDNHFNYWPYGNGAMASVSLVWKWDGKIYRLANFKLGKEIIRNIYRNLAVYYSDWAIPDTVAFDVAIQDTAIVRGFNASKEESYPVSLMESMLNLFYSGDSTQAIRLFNKIWPDDLPKKQEFYRLFREQMDSSPHWQELQKSDW